MNIKLNFFNSQSIRYITSCIYLLLISSLGVFPPQKVLAQPEPQPSIEAEETSLPDTEPEPQPSIEAEEEPEQQPSIEAEETT